MNATHQIPIRPGDRVKAVRVPMLCENRLIRSISGEVRNGRIYHVRDAFEDRETGEHKIRLTGRIGCSAADGAEIGLPACWFAYLSSSPGGPAMLDTEEKSLVSVRLPEQIAACMTPQVFLMLPEFLTYCEEANFKAVCNRWNSTWRVSKPLGLMHAEIAAEIAAGPHVEIDVPLSLLEVQGLAEICGRLGINPEAWLQGALGNLEIRMRRLAEAFVREPRSERKAKSRKDQGHER